ncbi:MAG: hypothetical protein CMH24_01830 [Nitrosomonadales bacterium]|nr:hypothetical protein [Nitrosomonadales bacterium]|tara:strand:- start:1079 stop:1342 length:264 start_codon:yes stop_codon:yes gene_type:complete
MFKIFLLIFLCFYNNLSAEEFSSDQQKIISVKNFTADKECQKYQRINNDEYCVKKRNITLNSCGPSSDWPCMDEKGCLVIDQFTKKN